MAESKFSSQQNSSSNGFKEAVCINAGRIYDSCSDKDCLEDLQVYFTPLNQAIIDNASMIKVKSVQVLTVLMNVRSRFVKRHCALSTDNHSFLVKKYYKQRYV